MTGYITKKWLFIITVNNSSQKEGKAKIEIKQGGFTLQSFITQNKKVYDMVHHT